MLQENHLKRAKSDKRCKSRKGDRGLCACLRCCGRQPLDAVLAV